MNALYKYILSFHLVAVISWMAGILYLIRLFVYHANESEAIVKSRFVIMERRLYRIITMPAMGVSLLLGIIMLMMSPALLRQPWMHAKLFLVVLLMGVTHYAGRIRKKLEEGTLPQTEKFFRVLNEVPTVLMILIVLLVIVRPF